MLIRYSVVVLVCALVFTSIGCASTQSVDRAENQELSMSEEMVYASKARMRVDGLGCPMCAESISILLKDINGVQSSTVDLSQGYVHVELDPQVGVAASTLRGAIEDGGFSFRSIEFMDRRKP